MAELKLYDYTELVEDPFWGDFYEKEIYIGEGSLSGAVVVGLIEAVPDNEAITVRINSGGGKVYDGWAIYNALIAAKKRGCKIIVRIEALAASIASIIAMAGDEIIICQAAMLMIHKPSLCAWAFDMFVTSDDLDRESSALKQIQAVINDIYAARTGLDAAIIDGMINKETWITPTEAVTMGFADSIEATIVPIEMQKETFARTFRNANPRMREYANKIVTIKDRKMDAKETIKNSKNESKKALNVWNSIKKALNIADDEAPVNGTTELVAGGTLYFEGDAIAVNTEVFVDEEMTEHPAEGDHDIADAKTITVDENGIVTEIKNTVAPAAEDHTEELTNLRNEVAELKAELSEATNTIKTMSSAMNKIKNVKSTFEPEKRTQEMSNRGREVPKNTIDREEQKKRKEEYKSTKNNSK